MSLGICPAQALINRTRVTSQHPTLDRGRFSVPTTPVFALSAPRSIQRSDRPQTATARQREDCQWLPPLSKSPLAQIASIIRLQQTFLTNKTALEITMKEKHIPNRVYGDCERGCVFLDKSFFETSLFSKQKMALEPIG